MEITKRTFKMKIKILSLLILILSIAACSGSINTTLIGKGNLHGGGTDGIGKQNLVIREAESWKNLMNLMNSDNPETNNFSETDIDFSEFQIIAVFEKVNGQEVDLNITEEDGKIIVNISHVKPGDGTAPILHPYYIAKIPNSDLPIVFEEN